MAETSRALQLKDAVLKRFEADADNENDGRDVTPVGPSDPGVSWTSNSQRQETEYADRLQDFDDEGSHDAR
jgi:hypothetical protein